ncbi:hypothetical protein Tco_1464859 [Tanacetum coccineum]
MYINTGGRSATTYNSRQQTSGHQRTRSRHQLYRGGYRRFGLSVHVIHKINECLNYKNGVNWMLNAGRSIHGTCTVKPLGGARERAPAVFCRKALTQSATFIHECVKRVLTMLENMILIGTIAYSQHIANALAGCCGARPRSGDSTSPFETRSKSYNSCSSSNGCNDLGARNKKKQKVNRMQLLPTHGTEQGQTLHETKQAMEVVGSWFMGAMLHADVQKAMEKEFEKGVYITKVDELKKQGDRIEQRYKEHAERDSVVHQLISYITCYKQDAASNDLKYEHIDINEKQKVNDHKIYDVEF